MGQYKGISRAGETVNMMFRVGRFWEVVGRYCVHAAWFYVHLSDLHLLSSINALIYQHCSPEGK
jgi:hypothetical protein